LLGGRGVVQCEPAVPRWPRPSSEAGFPLTGRLVHDDLPGIPEGRVAEVPPKFARVGGSRPDFGPEKAKKHKKTLIKSKLNQN
jgi:hypothetical protein